MAENDITKTGPLRYKQLQQLNTVDYARQSAVQSIRMSGNVGYKPQEIRVKSDLGRSKYDDSDRDYNAADLENLDQLRYENQGVLDTIGNGLAKFAGKVGSTVIGTFAGIPTGIGTAIAEGRLSGLWDNNVTQALDDFDKFMESNFKNYQSNNQQNASWLSWENFGSAHFWMDDVVTNAGFTVGAILSGNLTGEILGASTSIARSLAASAAKNIAGKGFLEAALSLTKAAQTATKFGQKSASLASSVIAATAEGSVEAKQAQGEYYNKGYNAINEEFTNRFRELDLKYGNNKGAEYATAKAELEKQYKASIEQLSQESREIGNRVLLGNQVLLTLGNWIQFGKSFSKSFENAARLELASNKAVGTGAIRNTGRSFSQAAENMSKQMAANGGKATEEMAANSGIKLIADSPMLGRTGVALKGFITEGSEEMNQQWITSGAESQYENRHKTVDSYWQDRLNPNSRNVVDLINEFGSAIADGFNKSWWDFDQWEQFLIGGMMGAGGMYMPTKIFNQDKTKKWWDPRRYGSYEGGMINDLIEYNKQQSLREGNAKKLNELLSTEKFWNHWYKEKQSLATSLAIQSRQDEHLSEGNKKAYKDDEDDYFAHVIGTFARAGKLEGLKAIYNSHVNMSDEEIDNLVKQSTTKQNNKEALQAKASSIQTRIQSLLETKQNLIEIQQEDIASSGTSDISNDDINSYDQLIQEAEKELDEVRNTPVEEHFVGPYVDSNGTRIKENDEIREELNHVSEAFNQKLEAYQEAARRVQKDTRGAFNDEQDDLLTYLAFKGRNSLSRADSLYEKHPLLSKNITIANLALKGDEITTDREQIRDTLGLNDNDIVANSDGTFTINTNGMSVSRQRSVFSRAIRGSDENLALLNKQLKQKALDKGISGQSWDDAIQDIEDIFSLEESAQEYEAKLWEYRLMPQNIERDKNDIKDNEDKKAKKQAIKDQLGGKSINDILNAMNDEELPTNLELSSIEDEDLRSNYKEAQKIFKKYKSISNAIENADINDAEKVLLSSLLDDKLANAASVEDLLGITPQEIQAANRDDILDLTGFDSVEELAAAVGMADQVDASDPTSLDGVIDDIKNGALEAMDKVLGAEEKKTKKKEAEPKKRTADEKKKDEKAESADDSSTGHDGGTKAKDTKNRNTIDLGEVVIAGKPRKVRAIRTYHPGTKDVFEIKFQYDNEGKWQDAYVPIDKSFFKELTAKDGKGNDITLDSLADKDGKIKVLSIKTDNYKGSNYHYAEVDNGKLHPKQAYYKNGKTGKRFSKPVRVILKSDSSIDKMLGVEEGTLGKSKAKGTPLNVSKVRTLGNKTDEDSIKQEAAEDAKKFSNQESASMDKKTVLKPQSTRFYIHPFQKSGNIFKPYWEIEDDLNSVPESERTETVTIKDKSVKVSKRAAIHKAIHDYFLKNGVFDRQDQLKPGDEITFGFSKELNNSLPEGSDPVLLMFDKDGNVVGDVASPVDERLFTTNTSIANLYKHSRNDNDSPREGSSDTTVLMYSDNEGHVHPITTQVANRYIGTPQYGNENRPASEVLVTNNSEGQPIPDFELGVVMGDYSGNTIRTSNGAKVRTPSSAKTGQPYVLIHTSDPKRPWYPVSILMNTLNSDSLKGTDFYNVFVNQLGGIKNAANNNTLKNFKDNLRKWIALSEDDLFISKNEDGSISIKIKGDVVATVTAEDLALTSTQIGQKLIEDLSKTSQPITLNISKDLFGKTFTFYNEKGEELTRNYKDLIGPLIYTNAVSNHTVNDFFDVNPIEFNDKGVPIGVGKSKKMKAPKTSEARESRTPTKDSPKNTVKGGYYYMDGETIVVSDKEGNPIVVDKNTPQKDALNAAYTYVLAQGFTEDGSYDVPYYGGRTLIVNNGNLSWGKDPISKNPETNKFVDKFQADQEKVNRDATDSEHYEIDGNYHVRLHARIDSLYGDNVSISETQKNAMESIRKGLIKAFNDGVTIDNIISNYDAYLNFLDADVRQAIAEDYAFRDNATPEQFIDDVMNAVRDKVTGFRGSRALKVGQAIDDAVREFFLDPEKGLPEHNKYKGTLSDNAYRQLRLALDQLYQQYGSKYSFISDKLVVNANIGGADVAGELDLLAINKETGEVEIWDIKTSARSFINADGTLSDNFTSHGSKFARSSQEQYTIQLNAYKDMIKAKYGIDVVGLKILPLFVEYSDNGNGSQVAKVTRQDLIPLEMKDDVLVESKKGSSKWTYLTAPDGTKIKGHYTSNGVFIPEASTLEVGVIVLNSLTGQLITMTYAGDIRGDNVLSSDIIKVSDGAGGNLPIKKSIVKGWYHKVQNGKYAYSINGSEVKMASSREELINSISNTSSTPKTEVKWDEKTVRSQLLNNLGNTARGKKTLEKIMPELLALDEETRDKIAKYLNAHNRIAGLSTMLSKKIVPMLVEKSKNVGRYSRKDGHGYKDISQKDYEEMVDTSRFWGDADYVMDSLDEEGYNAIFALIRISITKSKIKPKIYRATIPNSSKAVAFADAYNNIYIDINKLESKYGKQELNRVLAHELIHILTANALDTNAVFRKEIEDIYSRTVQWLYFKNKEALSEYGISDIYEFIAEAFTNPEFAEILNNIEDNKSNGKYSLFQKFVRAIKRFLGIQNKDQDSILDSVLGSSLQYGKIQIAPTKRISSKVTTLQDVLNTINSDNNTENSIDVFNRQRELNAIFIKNPQEYGTIIGEIKKIAYSAYGDSLDFRMFGDVGYYVSGEYHYYEFKLYRDTGDVEITRRINKRYSNIINDAINNMKDRYYNKYGIVKNTNGVSINEIREMPLEEQKTFSHCMI